MRIVADANMPMVRELFGPFGEVCQVPGRDLSPADVADADVLLVRSTTRVDESLLRDSPVRFVGTATIGVDHVDVAWLASRQIAFASAPGCNARAVVEYDLAALTSVAPDWMARRIGVVGCGNVGGRLLRQLWALNVEAVGYDPLIAPVPGLVAFDDILQCDIICLHTPLTRDGPWPTWHLFDGDVIDALRPGTVLLNAGRGAVVDNVALDRRLQQRGDLTVVLDVWEDEPRIHQGLMSRVALATPHIAGYSQAGRIRGTTMLLSAFIDWMGRGHCPAPAMAAEESLGEVASIQAAIQAAYPIVADHRAMLAAIREAEDQGGADRVAKAFDRLRRDYPQRREFAEFSCSVDPARPGLARQLERLGFRVGFRVNGGASGAP